MSDPFLGEIKVFGFNFPPRGYQLCWGQTLAISQYTALFSLLSTFYGGDGQSNFKLPDLRSRLAIGQGQGLGLSLYQMGQASGTENTTLLINNMPIHSHPVSQVPIGFTPPTAATTINAYTAPTARQTSPANALLTGAMDANGVVVNTYSTAGTAATLASGAATTTLNGGGVSGGQVTLGNNGGSLPFNNLQPYLTINYSIATVGIYPTRN